MCVFVSCSDVSFDSVVCVEAEWCGDESVCVDPSVCAGDTCTDDDKLLIEADDDNDSDCPETKRWGSWFVCWRAESDWSSRCLSVVNGVLVSGWEIPRLKYFGNAGFSRSGLLLFVSFEVMNSNDDVSDAHAFMSIDKKRTNEIK